MAGMYVWVDALTNYITGVGYPDIDSEKFKRYWPAALHVIGKDIVRFHAVYWPAFLMSAGVAVPEHIFSHGFLFNRGEKMSKSVGNVIDPFTMADTYGVDQFRYFFLREVPFGQDGNYSHAPTPPRNDHGTTSAPPASAPAWRRRRRVMQDDVGFDDLLQRRTKRRHQHGRKIRDESDRIRQDRLDAARQLHGA